MVNAQYDVIIVGAGMVGAALACALGDSAIKVAVIEYSAPQLTWPDDSVDLRFSAISRSSEYFFHHLGAWDNMVARGVSPYTDMHVWDGGSKGAVHFDSADIGESSMGHIIENRVVRAALLERMQTFPNIDFICPAELAAIELAGHGVKIGLQDGGQLTGALLVGADGGRSQVREAMGISSVGWSYRQKGVVAIVSTALAHQETAWQRFLSTGPLAFLPLKDGRCSIVWSTTHEAADTLCALDEQTFCRQLAEAFEHKLGDILDSTNRAAFPLGLRHAERYTQHRVALIGDAAHTIHPLAGQGANLGFMDAACLAECVLEASDLGRDLGSVHHLRKYERWRKGDNLSMMFAMDGFKRLFSNDFSLLSKIRGCGLTVTDKMSPVKHVFMRRAMGLEGELPRLAKRPVS